MVRALVGLFVCATLALACSKAEEPPATPQLVVDAGSADVATAPDPGFVNLDIPPSEDLPDAPPLAEDGAPVDAGPDIPAVGEDVAAVEDPGPPPADAPAGDTPAPQDTPAPPEDTPEPADAGPPDTPPPPPEALCADGLDNDGDDLIDCLDADCDGASGCELGSELTCGDNLDNDADALTDCADPDCDGVAGCELGEEFTCGDGADNDADTLTDCADPDCDGIAGCQFGQELLCADGKDNDADTLTDCADPDCADDVSCEDVETTCDDKKDNDGDTLTDCADPDCDGLAGCEYGKELTCDDGDDNDADGAVDCADLNCHGIAGCWFGAELTCTDGKDNDADGATDCQDPDCDGQADCEFGQELSCADNEDNDSDGASDCLDSDCDGIGDCEYWAELTCDDGEDNDQDGPHDCLDTDCDGVTACEFGQELTCDDNVDNDADGAVDCLDTDCQGVAGCELGAEATCDDEVDNDADGLTDCADGDCDGLAGCELGEELTCDDGVDNDGDGPLDCSDPDCNGKDGCELALELTCDDGVDNDADEAVDCADVDCDGVDGCEYGIEGVCNDGLDNDADGVADCADEDCFVCAGECCGVGWYCEFGQCKVQCEVGEQCGAADDICCAEGEACISDQCTQPSGPCEFDEDCAIDEICEPILGQCLPEDLVDLCEFVPPVGLLQPVVGCRWKPPNWAAKPGRNNVCMNPVVANLSDDNGDGETDTSDIPDIVFTAWDHAKGGCCNEPATVWIASGECNPDGTMNTIAELQVPDVDESAGLAIGDLNKDGIPEIVAMKLLGGAVAYERTSPDGSQWAVLWENDDYPTFGVHTNGGPQPSLADLDADGFPEVIVGNVVLNGTDGTLRWDGVVTAAGKGGIGNNAFLGPVSTVADIDLLMPLAPEIIAGNTVYRADGTVLWTFKYAKGGYCQGALPCDGFNAVGNFDDDDEGEVVIIRQGEIFIIEHDGTLKLKISVPWQDCKKSGNVANESGPPTIADFDGDGYPEIGTAGADYYAVADLQCVGTPLPAGCDSKYIRWKTPNKDCSSRATASSVFDFEGDGKAEVVYADETSFRILDGSTGAVLYNDNSHGSNTRVEMPVVADVDNDGSAEIIIPENQNGGGTPGVEVWDDADGNWVRSRRIWNQHSYHITNVSETGVVPAYELPNWLDPRFNNFRQNTQPTGVHYAPDLFVEAVEVTCADPLVITACIGNAGMLGVPAGVVVTGVLQVNNGPTIDLGATETGAPILPGQCRNASWTYPPPPEIAFFEAPFSVTVHADDDGTVNGEFNECVEDNNATIHATSCPYITPNP